MKSFLDQDFLLQTDTARELYHEHAAKMPIIDYHCHLDPRQIAENHQFEDLTEIWLGGDITMAGDESERYSRGIYHRR